jgi:hypothetical protein
MVLRLGGSASTGIERQQEVAKEVVFRADAAFAKPEIYEVLGQRGVKCAIRLPVYFPECSG